MPVTVLDIEKMYSIIQLHKIFLQNFSKTSPERNQLLNNDSWSVACYVLKALAKYMQKQCSLSLQSS